MACVSGVDWLVFPRCHRVRLRLFSSKRVLQHRSVALLICPLYTGNACCMHAKRADWLFPPRGCSICIPVVHASRLFSAMRVLEHCCSATLLSCPTYPQGLCLLAINSLIGWYSSCCLIHLLIGHACGYVPQGVWCNTGQHRNPAESTDIPVTPGARVECAKWLAPPPPMRLALCHASGCFPQGVCMVEHGEYSRNGPTVE